MPMIYATPQEPEAKPPTVMELYEAIDPNLYYPGLFVREFAELMFQEANEVINIVYQRAIMEGAAMAARPLQARIEGLVAWQDEAKEKLNKDFWDGVLWVAGALVTGFVIGVVVH